MAGLGYDFDPTEQDTSQRSFDNLPKGTYRLEATESEVHTTEEEGRIVKARAAFTMSVLEPEQFKERKIFLNINHIHTSAEAQQIGQQELARLCRAIGYEGRLNDTADLHFKPFTAELGMGKDSKEKNADGTSKYPARTEIKKYYYPDEGDPPAAKADPVAANDNRPATNGTVANDNASIQRSTHNGGAAPSRPAGSKPWAKKSA